MMSRPEMVKVTCPNCKKETDFKIWTSINTKLDPELKSQVRDCSVFLFECPECGDKNSINYGFLYHQMEDKMMIHYANSEENAQEILDLYNNKEDEMIGSLLDNGYLIRLVFSREALLEKLAIFDAGLDDRIVEIVKLLYVVQLKDTDEVEGVYFVVNGNEKHIEFVSKGKVFASANVDEDFYSNIEKDFIGKLPEINKDNIIIDSNWAIECLRNNR